MPIPIVVIGAVAATAGYLVYKSRPTPTPLDEPLGDPEDPEGWPRRLARATREGDWVEVARLRVRMAGLERGDARLGHLLEAARLYEERLGDADSAIRCYEEALLVNPEDSEALAGLEFLQG